MQDAGEFRESMDRHIAELREAGDSIHLPGDGAAELERERRETGIPIPDPLLGQLRSLADRFELTDRLQY